MTGIVSWPHFCNLEGDPSLRNELRLRSG